MIAPTSTPSRPPAFAWVDDAPLFQAGLAGYSDTAMRLVARRHGCPYCITEALLDQLLIGGGKGRRAARLHDDDHPIAGQIIGYDPREMARAASIIATMGYDVVDVNFGCPVRKIRKRNRGGHLLSDPARAIAILDAVRQAVGDRPLSVKMRRAYDDSPAMAANFYRIFEAAIGLGYAAITVHGRTVQQKYVGPSRWAFLTDLTRRYRTEMQRGLLVFGSGDIFTPQAVIDMITQTGVSGVSVARGCIGNPWVFQQVRQLMRGDGPTPPTLAQQRQVLMEHFELSVATHGEPLAGRLMRKFGIRFSSHHPQNAQVKDAFVQVKSLADWQAVLDAYYTCDEGDSSRSASSASVSSSDTAP